MEKILFEIPVEVAIERIRLAMSRHFSYLYQGEWYEISITDTMKIIAKNPRCCFCGAKATRAFVIDNGTRFNIKFFTEKNGELILFTKDHRVPKSKGGKDKFSNYQTACEKCNKLKGDTTKDNEMANLIIDLKDKIQTQKRELRRLSMQNEALIAENEILRQENDEFYFSKLMRFCSYLKKIFNNIIDKTHKVWYNIYRK